MLPFDCCCVILLTPPPLVSLTFGRVSASGSLAAVPLPPVVTPDALAAAAATAAAAAALKPVIPTVVMPAVC